MSPVLRRTAAALAAPVLAGLLLTGCGGDDAGLSTTAAAALQADVEAVTTAVNAKDGVKARAALAALRDEVARQLAAGEVSGERAQTILTAAGDVAAGLPSPRPAATRSPTPKPVVQAPEREGDDRDDDRGKGKGNDKDD